MKIQEADAKSLLVAQGLPVPPGRSPTPPPRRAPPPSGSSPTGAAAGRDQGPGPRRRPGQGRRREARRRPPTRPRPSPRRSSASRSRASRSARSSSGRPPTSSRSSTSSAVLDRASRRILAHGLRRGRRRDRAGRRGATPTRSSRSHADPLLGLLDCQARELAFALGLGGAPARRPSAIAKGLVRTMLAYDADLVEINPLAIVREHGADGAAVERLAASTPRSPSTTPRLSRHPELEALRDPDEEDPADSEAREAGPHVHQARRHDRLHGQRRRPGDDDDGPRQARRRRAGELPRHRRRRAGRQGRRGDAPDPRRPEGERDPRQHLRRASPAATRSPAA